MSNPPGEKPPPPEPPPRPGPTPQPSPVPTPLPLPPPTPPPVPELGAVSMRPQSRESSVESPGNSTASGEKTPSKRDVDSVGRSGTSISSKLSARGFRGATGAPFGSRVSPG